MKNLLFISIPMFYNSATFFYTCEKLAEQPDKKIFDEK